MAKVRVVLNQAAVRSEILQAESVGAALEAAARQAAPEGAEVERSIGRTRQQVRIRDRRADAMDREAKTGGLSSMLGRVRL